MSMNRLKFYVPRVLRWGNWVLASTAAFLVGLHHWFPGILAWLPVEAQVAIALGVFAFLTDRILAVQQHLDALPITVYKTRELAYEHLLDVVKKYGASKIDLVQFSGATSVSFLKGVAAIGKNVEVRLFVVDDDQARRFDQHLEAGAYHLRRISSTFDALQLTSQDHPNFRVKTFRYPGNAEVSAIVVDDFCASLGWNRSYIDEEHRVLRMRGHDTPAVNVIQDRSLLDFARLQIQYAEKFAVECNGERNRPVGPSTTRGQ